MDTRTWALIVWLAFDIVVFAWAWWDDFYYSHNVKGMFKRIKDAITEE